MRPLLHDLKLWHVLIGVTAFVPGGTCFTSSTSSEDRTALGSIPRCDDSATLRGTVCSHRSLLWQARHAIAGGTGKLSCRRRHHGWRCRGLGLQLGDGLNSLRVAHLQTQLTAEELPVE